MEIGDHIMAWRRDKGLTQNGLALRSGLTRAYLSRLEGGGIDPGLSALRRLAAALKLRLGQMLEEVPEPKTLTRHQLDRLARAAIRPGTQESRGLPAARVLSRVMRERRKALGLYAPRKRRRRRLAIRSGKNAARWLRASVGEEQWKALLRRIDKLASFHAGTL